MLVGRNRCNQQTIAKARNDLRHRPCGDRYVCFYSLQRTPTLFQPFEAFIKNKFHRIYEYIQMVILNNFYYRRHRTESFINRKTIYSFCRVFIFLYFKYSILYKTMRCETSNCFSQCWLSNRLPSIFLLFTFGEIYTGKFLS